MITPHKGDFVEMDGLIAVVVATDDDPNVPDEHVALWFGSPPMKRISEGGSGAGTPEVSTVPLEYCRLLSKINFVH
jgi:hypothetical protein